MSTIFKGQNMQKFISSSVFKDFKEAVNLAKKLDVNLEISRFTNNLEEIDEIFESRVEEMKADLKDFEGELNLHAFFIDLSVAAADPKIRKISRERMQKCFEAAKYFGVKTVVFHTGFNASLKFKDYYEYFEQEFILYWKEFIKDFEHAGITAVLENVEESSPEFILRVIKSVNSPNLKASIDIGHANLHSDVQISDWIKTYGENLYHMHLHNNFGDDDTHNSLLNGWIDIKKVIDTLEELNLKPKMVFEIFNKEAVEESIAYFNNLIESKTEILK